MRSQEQHVCETKRHFDGQAARYDRSRTVRGFQARAQALVTAGISLRPGMHVLDLGCGTGTGTLEIASRLGGTGEVLGLDASPKMIAEARRKVRRSGAPNVAFAVGAAEALEPSSSRTSVTTPGRCASSIAWDESASAHTSGARLVADCDNSWNARASSTSASNA
jgi:ubiquinone/menaquinone biosynthesis C-methylase UbiE